MTENLVAPPAVVGDFLTASTARDVDRALAALTPDAVVVDDGSTHRGTDEIADWLRRAASEYRYSSTLTGVERVDDEHWVTTHHLEGDFPGGVVDLRYRFTLSGDRVAEVVIAP
ncbi:nuclear transport factor 2 family protein [Modestobacter sp. NPDC049651]|uniref:nuclear transport factor 2 family protein n=1 Tax=unclassified Modestobacter TaxID=2643866 RepID=UPI0033C9E424